MNQLAGLPRLEIAVKKAILRKGDSALGGLVLPAFLVTIAHWQFEYGYDRASANSQHQNGRNASASNYFPVF